MAEEEDIMLSDKQIVPTEELIFSIIGEYKIFWQEIMNYMRNNYTESTGEWNFYKDGNRWLYKHTQKKKTIFWSAIFSDTFRITFYFGDKAEPVIIASKLPDRVKKDFLTGKRYGKIRAISLKIYNMADIEIVKTLVEIKVK